MGAKGEMATTEGESDLMTRTAKTTAETARGGDSMGHIKVAVTVAEVATEAKAEVTTTAKTGVSIMIETEATIVAEEAATVAKAEATGAEAMEATATEAMVAITIEAEAIVMEAAVMMIIPDAYVTRLEAAGRVTTKHARPTGTTIGSSATSALSTET